MNGRKSILEESSMIREFDHGHHDSNVINALRIEKLLDDIDKTALQLADDIKRRHQEKINRATKLDRLLSEL